MGGTAPWFGPTTLGWLLRLVADFNEVGGKNYLRTVVKSDPRTFRPARSGMRSGEPQAAPSTILVQKAANDAQQLDGAVRLGHVVIAPGGSRLLFIALHSEGTDGNDRD
jgi:hypothetical protein